MDEVDNTYIIEKVKEYKSDLYREHITPDLSPEHAALKKSFIEMGADITLKLLLEFTVPLYQKAERNTVFVKRMVKVWGTIITVILTTLGAALLNLILKS